MTLNKCIIFLTMFFAISSVDASYMNDERITWKTIVTGSAATSIDYNIVDNGDGQFGGDIRVYGIHSMWIQVAGYKRIDLIKKDICLHPHLFTILGYFLDKDNTLTQRWACVKWWYPLSFGFKIKDNSLHISSTIYKYRFLCLFRSGLDVELVKEPGIDESKISENPQITVSVNGRTVVVDQRTIVQLYSWSSTYPYAVLARMLFL